ncbi:MAG: hypothetical protein R3291_03505 [Thermoplasmata archaeon]|nr:hypothetical protein [Thermoplasmata archaeon]
MTDHWTVLGLRVGVLVAGALVTWWALRLTIRARAHRGTYLLLGLGFGLVTLGALVEGILFEFGGWSLLAAHTAEAFVTAGGLGLILVSIILSRV